MKGALGMGHLSLKWLTGEGLEGGFLYWGPWVMKVRFWRWAVLFMGAQLGYLDWARVLGNLTDD